MDLTFDFFSSKLWKRLLVFYLPCDSQKIATEILKWFQCLNHVLKGFSFFVGMGGCCREFLYDSLLKQNSKPIMIVERELNCIWGEEKQIQNKTVSSERLAEKSTDMAMNGPYFLFATQKSKCTSVCSEIPRTASPGDSICVWILAFKRKFKLRLRLFSKLKSKKKKKENLG